MQLLSLSRLYRLRIAGALTAPLAALLMAGAPTASAHAGISCAAAHAEPGEASAKQRITATVCLVNRERRARGVRVLRVDPRLTRAALRHSRDMRRRGFFGHVNPDGRTLADRARQTGYSADVAENLSRGTATPAEVVRAWMRSPSHRRNLLARRHRGIGAAVSGRYWTHAFGTRTPPASGITGLERRYRTH